MQTIVRTKLMQKKFLISSIAVITLLVIALSSFFLHNAGTARAESASVQPSATSTKEYGTPCSYPWGTALDNSGANLWVACPGQDPSPYFGSSTPGKFTVFNIASRTFTKTYTVKAG